MPSRKQTRRLGSAGFTLVELMISVAVIGILSAVAIPQYRDYVRRGSLPEATSGLSASRIRLEQYYQDNRNYGVGGVCAGGALATSTKYFQYSCTTNGQTYTLTAEGLSGRAEGHIYTLNESNAQATTKFKGEAVANKPCWLLKGDEC